MTGAIAVKTHSGIPARRRIAAGLASLALLGAGCHRTVSPREKVSGPPVRQDTLGVVRPVKDLGLEDTALVTGTVTERRTFDLRTAGQRDSFLALLKKERQLWRAHRPLDYRFLLRVGCFCPDTRGWLLMEVRGGKLRAWNRAGKPVALTDWNTLSIDGLFDMLEQSVNGEAVVTVGFHPRLHFPVSVHTAIRLGPDAWATYEARGLRAL